MLTHKNYDFPQQCVSRWTFAMPSVLLLQLASVDKLIRFTISYIYIRNYCLLILLLFCWQRTLNWKQSTSTVGWRYGADTRAILSASTSVADSLSRSVKSTSTRVTRYRVHNSRRPLDRFFALFDLWPWPLTFWSILLLGWRGIVMDYPCAKFDGFSFCRFGFIVRTDRQTHTHTESQTALIAIFTRLSSAWVMSHL